LTSLLVSACQNSSSTSETTSDKQDNQATSTSQVSIDNQLLAAATSLNITATDAEGPITALLQDLAVQSQAQLRGLTHRLKTKSSTLRKLKKIYKQQLSQGISPSTDTLKITDALRYTFEVGDQPPGHYVKTVNETLKALEAKGFKVVKVKNYWPKGDNYSGVNTALLTQSGLAWELQFHTASSYQEAKRSHELYEQLRSTETSLKRRQELFSQMSSPWETIGVPQGVLEPKNLHDLEEIKKWSAPQ